MRTKVTLVLLFLNVALFFFIFQFERRWRTEESWKEARRRVLGAEAADIRSLEITGGTHVLALAKRGDTWFVTSPLEWPANPNAINRILTELQFLEHETSFNVADLAKSGLTLANYGLDQPRLTITPHFGRSRQPLAGRQSHPRHGPPYRRPDQGRAPPVSALARRRAHPRGQPEPRPQPRAHGR